MKPVKLKEIVDEMEMQMDEYRKFLNRETGAIVIFTCRKAEGPFVNISGSSPTITSISKGANEHE